MTANFGSLVKMTLSNGIPFISGQHLTKIINDKYFSTGGVPPESLSPKDGTTSLEYKQTKLIPVSTDL